LGFSEALVRSVPSLAPYFEVIALSTAAVLFVVAYVGATWAIKVQYLVLAVLCASIAVFLGGALIHFSPETFVANLPSAYTSIESGDIESGTYDIWLVFAIYFPAVTGIMAGINMSGDLKNPMRSIPRGTLAAIGVGFLAYAMQLVVFGGAFDRADLINRPFLTLKENALFNLGWLVTCGMFAASLSSGLGSFMGAPRVLQAVSRDKILPVLGPFAKGARRGDEPRRALWVTGGITFAVLLWARNAAEGDALNAVAGVITEFFLYTYGMLNVAAFIEAVSDNPSFRPQFRLFHWATALAGSVGCVGVAFIINPYQAAVSFLVLTALVWYIRSRKLRATFGDVRRGFIYNSIRDNLLRLSRMAPSAKNWRPTCLIFAGKPQEREVLVRYGVWFEADRGLVFLVQILVGSLEEYGPRRAAAVRQLAAFCQEREIHAFPVVVVSEDLEQGMANVIQSLCIGPIQPNLAMFGWSNDPERITFSLDHFRLASTLGMAIVAVAPGAASTMEGKKRVDIWWRGKKNGGLMLLLAHLLRENWEWDNTETRLLRLIENRAGYETTVVDLQGLVSGARVEAVTKVIVSDRPFGEILREESADAACVFLGFELPEQGDEANWHDRYRSLMLEGPTTVLVRAIGSEDILA
jgi:amino acid transporter